MIKRKSLGIVAIVALSIYLGKHVGQHLVNLGRSQGRYEIKIEQCVSRGMTQLFLRDFPKYMTFEPSNDPSASHLSQIMSSYSSGQVPNGSRYVSEQLLDDAATRGTPARRHVEKQCNESIFSF